MLTCFLLIIVCSFLGHGAIVDSFKEGCLISLSFFVGMLLIMLPSFLLDSHEDNLAYIAIGFDYFIFICVLIYVWKKGEKTNIEIERKKEEVGRLFGEEYAQYAIAYTNEEIQEMKDKAESEKKILELSPEIIKTYKESELNTLFDTFFALDSYVYIIGLSLGYKESEIKKHIKDWKLNYSIDNKANYVIDYNLAEEYVNDTKIIMKISDFGSRVSHITLKATLTSYDDIKKKLTEYIDLLLESTLFKTREDVTKDKNACFQKYITDKLGEFYNIDIKITKEGTNYELNIQIGTNYGFANYYDDEKSTYNFKGKAKDRIRSYRTQNPSKETSMLISDYTTSEQSCFVYLMVDTTNNYHKIGISNNPEYREKTLQSEKPTIEKICAKEYPSRKIAESIEKALHASFADKRIRGEWFALNDQEVGIIIKTLSN